MKDLCIVQDSDPTILIEVGEALGNSGVNIEGLSLSTLGNKSVVHFLVNDEQAAIKALEPTALDIESVSDVSFCSKTKSK
ncbi:hypothetical protein F9817_08270 [Vibrio sp. CAIM 722]|uniref:ACT domain-containing protein n=1 Tax=Vibrio eleionomae TaxID=2653505 RepID=A0A7X4RUE3_9VIBR|nr:hypothetical protein [Vibrio eleionomae]MZI93190.1 hypothetical protein [Vibrio eleionomae]